MVTCFHCHQQTTDSEHARVVHNKTPLHGPWSGWRMAGRELVGPSGERITPERLRGILWRDEQDLRLAGHRSRRKAEKAVRQGSVVKVVIVQLSDWQERHFGTRAG